MLLAKSLDPAFGLLGERRILVNGLQPHVFRLAPELRLQKSRPFREHRPIDLGLKQGIGIPGALPDELRPLLRGREKPQLVLVLRPLALDRGELFASGRKLGFQRRGAIPAERCRVPVLKLPKDGVQRLDRDLAAGIRHRDRDDVRGLNRYDRKIVTKSFRSGDIKRLVRW
ncbi:MAG: hypothetical protein JOZ58_24115, partial [Acetobacteraceae bacterium]|nr:hypothetical protein [Acetobacteraceae bacterium]